MAKHIFAFSFLLVLAFTSMSCFSFQNIANLFPSGSTLQIISDFKTEQSEFWIAEFLNLLLQNPYFLRVLYHRPIPHSIEVNPHYASCESNEFIFSEYFGHTNTQISFILQPQLETDSEKDKLIETRKHLNYCGESPNFIFLVLGLLNDKTFKISTEAASTSKMFVISGTPSQSKILKIYVVCWSCGFPLAQLSPPVGNLEGAWKLHNANLHYWAISSFGGPSFNSNRQTCSALWRGGKKFAKQIICAQLALGDKYNFSDVEVDGRQVKSPNGRDREGTINYIFAVPPASGFINGSFMYPLNASFSWLPHLSQRYEFRLATITSKKSKLEGLQGVVMPLDWYTWVASLVCFILIALFISVIM